MATTLITILYAPATYSRICGPLAWIASTQLISLRSSAYLVQRKWHGWRIRTISSLHMAILVTITWPCINH
ncbi:hypothetical protein EDD15DRAFT_2304109 [Pisolithus albus]|nr:hypothetical protein EDD15DRAFT_2304109 [Pisolithus albus]